MPFATAEVKGKDPKEMCVNFYLYISEWIYLMVLMGTGSWSFRSLWVVAWGDEKSEPSIQSTPPIGVPGGCEGFIMMHY